MTELDGLFGDSPQPATSAGLYDVALGGHHHTIQDREHLQRIDQVSNGDTTLLMRENRGFLRRAVRVVAADLVGAGYVPQLLDLGSGYPTAQNTHEVAQAVTPEARVVYVDYNPVVVRYGQALMQTRDRVEVERGDVQDPEQILHSDAVRRLIDWEEPVVVLLVAVLHFVPGDAPPILAAFRERMAPGSYLVLSHGIGGDRPQAETEEGWAIWNRGSSDPVQLRTPEQIGKLFDGFELLPPGLVPVSTWRPDEPTRDRPRWETVIGGVGLKTG